MASMPKEPEPAKRSKHSEFSISVLSHEKSFSLSFSGVGFRLAFFDVLILLLPRVPEMILNLLLISSNYFYR